MGNVTREDLQSPRRQYSAKIYSHNRSRSLIGSKKLLFRKGRATGLFFCQDSERGETDSWITRQRVWIRIRHASLTSRPFSPRASPMCSPGLGGFAAMSDLSFLKSYDQPVLLTTTDGVGTKLHLATLSIVTTVGIDLVAMCVNDLLVQDWRSPLCSWTTLHAAN